MKENEKKEDNRMEKIIRDKKNEKELVGLDKEGREGSGL